MDQHTPPRNSIRRSFMQGTPLTRLLYINVGAYLIFLLLQLLSWLTGIDDAGQLLLQYLGVPSDLTRLARAPWTPLTYMFAHTGFFHLLFNMLWLYLFGAIFQQQLSGRGLTAVYLFGGLAGAGAYILLYNQLPAFEILRPTSAVIGASGAVMAIVFAVCTTFPKHTVQIPFIGRTRLIYLALFTLVVNLISIPQGNSGGHIAHLGGALFGCIFSLATRRKQLDPGQPRRKKHTVKKVSEMTDREYNIRRRKKDDRINEILDKISRSGYN
ncbi:MAG: rhomboid family intramembrane serine protease, partial [Odoribacteraceae bacterium]|nr:rhomboid family intramembrane serine protease [Odoribacteraceae bacterium]